MRIILLSFLLSYYTIYLTVASFKCLEDQQSLLLQLKSNFTFDPKISTKLKLWNKSTLCCNWSGVSCDSEGQVIGLDLSGEHIVGRFDSSSSLFSLIHLQKLNLAYNNFSSYISLGFSKLEKLTYLNLSSYAAFVSQIPEDISQLTRLVTLDLSYPPISSFSSPSSIANLQKFIKNLTNIRQLYLDGVTITTQEWGNALLPLNDLQELSMSYCDLSGPLDSSLTKLVNLSVIVLDWNNFSSPVPDTFASFKKLTKLSLSHCGLIGAFPQKIFQIGTLSVIDLSSNYDVEGSFPNHSMSESLHSIRVSFTNFYGALPNFIGSLRKLSTLDLSSCQFNGTLPHSLSNLTHLTHLDLSFNNFSGAIPSSLFKLPSLEKIDFSVNRLNGTLPTSMSNLTRLRYINLFVNHISGAIPSSLFTLPSVETIDLSHNRLNGSLHLDEFFKLKNLTTLDLAYNRISIIENVANVDLSSIPKFRYLSLASCNLKTFPSFLINQSTLLDLDLSDNHIQGKIPNEIRKLHNLISLYLNHNQLQGSVPIFFKSVEILEYSNNNFSVVPQDIGNYLSSTKYISFSNNNLHGSIPDSLCNATQLQVLDISFNNFSGTIPPCLLTMTGNLEVLDLRKNSLTGSIPDMFPIFCFVTRLNFHGNQLQGPIPRSLSHCSFLEVFDIGSNQVVDHFPCFLNEIPTLSVLVLRNNKLHGSIECSKNKPWKSIQIVDIAFNNFSGKLPTKYFTTWERMILDEEVARDINYNMTRNYPYYDDSVTVTSKGQQQELDKILTIFKAIDFSFNFFVGPIPESLMDLKALYILNFSNNGLSGEIPSSIGSLVQLESLDLSNNSLVGEIPMQLASLSFLSYLNLSFNHLVGKIPTGTQLQSFQASSFEGNHGLYGPPLIEKPDGKRNNLHPQPTCGRLICSIDWNFLSVELGFLFGLGMIIGPIMFWKKWRVGYWKLADRILCKIFPWIHLEYATDRGKTYTVLRW